MSNQSTVTGTITNLKFHHKDLNAVKANRERKTPDGEGRVDVLMQWVAYPNSRRGLIIEPTFLFLYDDGSFVTDFSGRQYYYESGSCPVNFLRAFGAFGAKGTDGIDNDPHGLYTYVGWLSRERLAELAGVEIQISDFSMPAKDGSDDTDWFTIGEKTYSDFRPDLDENELEVEMTRVIEGW